MSTTKIYIIRHGETDLNAQGRLQGHADIPLNDNGIKVAKVTGDALKDISFDFIFTSPLSRAVETARLVTAPSSKRSGKTIPMIRDARLMEINWGQWDQLGCLPGNFQIPRDNFNLFYTDPFHFEAAPDGESISQVCVRVGSFFRDFCASPLYQGKTVLISSHGCSVRALLYHVTGQKSSFWRSGVPENCSVSLVELNQGLPSLVFEDRIYYDPSLCVNPYKST